MILRLRVQGFGFEVQGFGFLGLGFRVSDLRFRVWGLGVEIAGLGFWVSVPTGPFRAKADLAGALRFVRLRRVFRHTSSA